MVQVALSILKPAGSVGATVQLAIAPAELPKVMSARRGVTQILEAHRPLGAAMLRFIQLGKPLPPLKSMAQSQHGVTQILASALRAAKAESVE
jgi:hypothetical protein